MKEQRLNLEIHAELGKRFVPHLRTHLTRAYATLRTGPNELSIALVGDKRMSKLHEKYMGIAGPTDVLTFELEHDNRGRVASGEVVVCVPQAKRQALPRLPQLLPLPVRWERGQKSDSLQDELLLLCLHGLLHLCGYNDLMPRDAAAMHRAEDRILTRLGIGKVYARGQAVQAIRGHG